MLIRYHSNTSILRPNHSLGLYLLYVYLFSFDNRGRPPSYLGQSQRWACYIPFLFNSHIGTGPQLCHCKGHIMTGSFVGRGNQYIQVVKVLYCKLRRVEYSSCRDVAGIFQTFKTSGPKMKIMFHIVLKCILPKMRILPSRTDDD